MDDNDIDWVSLISIKPNIPFSSTSPSNKKFLHPRSPRFLHIATRAPLNFSLEERSPKARARTTPFSVADLSLYLSQGLFVSKKRLHPYFYDFNFNPCVYLFFSFLCSLPLHTFSLFSYKLQWKKKLVIEAKIYAAFTWGFTFFPLLYL